MERNRGHCRRNLWKESKRRSRKLDISQKGKEIEELAQEVYEQKCRKKQKYHIDLYGKDIYQVLREINEQKVLQLADELNMDKANMNIQELTEK